MIVKSESGKTIVERHHFEGKNIEFLNEHATFNGRCYLLSDEDAKTFKTMNTKHIILCNSLFLPRFAKLANWKIDYETGRVKGEYYDEKENVHYRTKWFSYKCLEGFFDVLYTICKCKFAKQ